MSSSSRAISLLCTCYRRGTPGSVGLSCMTAVRHPHQGQQAADVLQAGQHTSACEGLSSPASSTNTTSSFLGNSNSSRTSYQSPTLPASQPFCAPLGLFSLGPQHSSGHTELAQQWRGLAISSRWKRSLLNARPKAGAAQAASALEGSDDEADEVVGREDARGKDWEGKAQSRQSHARSRREVNDDDHDDGMSYAASSRAREMDDDPDSFVDRRSRGGRSGGRGGGRSGAGRDSDLERYYYEGSNRDRKTTERPYGRGRERWADEQDEEGFRPRGAAGRGRDQRGDKDTAGWRHRSDDGGFEQDRRSSSSRYRGGDSEEGWRRPAAEVNDDVQGSWSESRGKPRGRAPPRDSGWQDWDVERPRGGAADRRGSGTRGWESDPGRSDRRDRADVEHRFSRPAAESDWYSDSAAVTSREQRRERRPAADRGVRQAQEAAELGRHEAGADSETGLEGKQRRSKGRSRSDDPAASWRALMQESNHGTLQYIERLHSQVPAVVGELAPAHACFGMVRASHALRQVKSKFGNKGSAGGEEQQMTGMADALQQAETQVQSIIKTLRAHCAERLDELHGDQLSQVLLASALTGTPMDEQLLEDVLKMLVHDGCAKLFNAQEKSLLNVMSALTTLQLSSSPAEHAAHAAPATGKGTQWLEYQQQLLDAVCTLVTQHADAISANVLAPLLRCVARLGCSDPKVYEAAATSLASRRPELSPPSIAQLGMANRQLQQQQQLCVPALMDLLAELISRQPSAVTVHGQIDLVLPFVIFKQRQPDMFAALLAALPDRLRDLPAQKAALLLELLSTQQPIPRELLQAVSTKLLDDAQNPRLPKAAAQLLETMDNSGLYLPDICTELCTAVLKVGMDSAHMHESHAEEGASGATDDHGQIGLFTIPIILQASANLGHVQPDVQSKMLKLMMANLESIPDPLLPALARACCLLSARATATPPMTKPDGLSESELQALNTTCVDALTSTMARVSRGHVLVADGKLVDGHAVKLQQAALFLHYLQSNNPDLKLPPPQPADQQTSAQDPAAEEASQRLAALVSSGPQDVSQLISLVLNVATPDDLSSFSYVAGQGLQSSSKQRADTADEGQMQGLVAALGQLVASQPSLAVAGGAVPMYVSRQDVAVAQAAVPNSSGSHTPGSQQAGIAVFLVDDEFEFGKQHDEPRDSSEDGIRAASRVRGNLALKCWLFSQAGYRVAVVGRQEWSKVQELPSAQQALLQARAGLL